MDQTKVKIPVQNGLFTWPAERPQLIVSKCSQCGEIVFPRQSFCPECCTESMEEVALNSKGILKSFTGITAPPPKFKGEVPYTVGIVEFPEGIKILGLTTEQTPECLNPGMVMEVVVDTVFTVEEKEYVTYKFKPMV
jgi:uncharacterized protein